MSAATAMREAVRHGARLAAHDGALLIEAPAALPDALIAELRAHKLELLALLESPKRVATLERGGGLCQEGSERRAWPRTRDLDARGQYRLPEHLAVVAARVCLWRIPGDPVRHIVAGPDHDLRDQYPDAVPLFDDAHREQVRRLAENAIPPDYLPAAAHITLPSP